MSVFLGIFLFWVIIITVLTCLGKDEITKEDIEFIERLNKPQLEKMVVITNPDGSKSIQKIYVPRQNDGRRWGLSGIC